VPKLPLSLGPPAPRPLTMKRAASRERLAEMVAAEVFNPPSGGGGGGGGGNGGSSSSSSSSSSSGGGTGRPKIKSPPFEAAPTDSGGSDGGSGPTSPTSRSPTRKRPRTFSYDGGAQSAKEKADPRCGICSNPLIPCGACMEWLKKIAEVNPDFRVVTFTDTSCEDVFVSTVENIHSVSA